MSGVCLLELTQTAGSSSPWSSAFASFSSLITDNSFLSVLSSPPTPNRLQNALLFSFALLRVGRFALGGTIFGS